MNQEVRVIKASLYAGITDMAIGVLMFATGWHQWYYEHFHFFGVLGIGMICYSGWHYLLHRIR